MSVNHEIRFGISRMKLLQVSPDRSNVCELALNDDPVVGLDSNQDVLRLLFQRRVDRRLWGSQTDPDFTCEGRRPSG